MKFTFFETIGKLIVRYHSFFEEGIINTLIIAAFAVLFGTILGTLMASMRIAGSCRCDGSPRPTLSLSAELP